MNETSATINATVLDNPLGAGIWIGQINTRGFSNSGRVVVTGESLVNSVYLDFSEENFANESCVKIALGRGISITTHNVIL